MTIPPPFCGQLPKLFGKCAQHSVRFSSSKNHILQFQKNFRCFLLQFFCPPFSLLFPLGNLYNHWCGRTWIIFPVCNLFPIFLYLHFSTLPADRSHIFYLLGQYPLFSLQRPSFIPSFQLLHFYGQMILFQIYLLLNAKSLVDVVSTHDLVISIPLNLTSFSAIVSCFLEFVVSCFGNLDFHFMVCDFLVNFAIFEMQTSGEFSILCLIDVISYIIARS